MKQIFIGRHQEISVIQTLLQQDEKKLISINGVGGIGKTTLAKQVFSKFGTKNNVAAAYIDFDLISNRDVREVQLAIARSCGGPLAKAFIDYLRDLSVLRGKKDEVPIDLDKLEVRVQEAFDNLVSNSDKRFLIILDTLDRIQDSLLLAQLVILLKNLSRGLVIICGKKNTSVNSELMSIVESQKNFVEISLQPFNEIETREFFNANQEFRKLPLDQEHYKKLWLLTEGRPILLDLALVWINQSLDPDGFLQNGNRWPGRKYLEIPLEDLLTTIDYYRNRFASELVDGIRQLRSPLNRALMYMALIDFPCNTQMWERVLDLSKSSARELMKNLRKLFFVRDDDTLHDEMRVLILKYVLPALTNDTSTQLQRMYKDLLDFLKTEQALLENNNKELDGEPDKSRQILLNQLNQLDILLFVDLELAKHLFEYLFVQQRNGGDPYAMQRVVDTACKKDIKTLPEDFRNSILIARYVVLNFGGQEDQVEQQIRELESEKVLKPEKEIELLWASGYSEMKHDLRASLQKYQKALDIAKMNNLETYLAETLNYLGLVYRRIGDYQDSFVCFNECIDIYEKYNLLSKKAASLNNLAYVYRQIGQISKALSLARIAYSIREDIGDSVGLAYSNQTLGELYRDLSRLGEALERFRVARDIFSNVGRLREVGNIDVLMANIYRKEHGPAEAESFLQEAIDIFNQTHDETGLADVYNEYGCELRKRGHSLIKQKKNEQAIPVLKASEDYYQKSIQISKEIRYDYRLADNLADIALLYQYLYENAIGLGETEENSREFLIKAQDTAYQAIRISRRKGFILCESRALEAIGNVYYIQKKYFFRAFAHYYFPACLILADYYNRQGEDRYTRVFERVEKRILNRKIPAVVVRMCSAYMARRWREECPHKPEFAEFYETLASTWQ